MYASNVHVEQFIFFRNPFFVVIVYFVTEIYTKQKKKKTAIEKQLFPHVTGRLQQWNSGLS